MLNFGDGLEPIFIFVGLAILLIIGPLLRWYVMGMTIPNFNLSKPQYFELIPFVLIFIASLFVTREWYESSKLVIIIFASGLIFIYLHLAFYIIWSWIIMKRVKKSQQASLLTKSQKAILDWLRFLIIGLAVIWVSYVLNILDDMVPYVFGPIAYSLTIYFLSYKAFQLKVADLDGDLFKANDNHVLFNKIIELVVDKKWYLESDLSLSKLSKTVGKSTQLISSVINEYARQNFNDFINYYRIQDAKSLLSSQEGKKYTISSIAYDMGFSSLSSFNSAFKKFEGSTPSAYRKHLS
jgi:AraC-like DNA-binding protein